MLDVKLINNACMRKEKDLILCLQLKTKTATTTTTTTQSTRRKVDQRRSHTAAHKTQTICHQRPQDILKDPTRLTAAQDTLDGSILNYSTANLLIHNKQANKKLDADLPFTKDGCSLWV